MSLRDGLALALLLLCPACPHRPVASYPPAEPADPASPGRRPGSSDEEPFSPVPGAPRGLGSPPFRLAVLADPSPPDHLVQLVQLLRENLRRGGAFIVDKAPVPWSTVRVGTHGATLYIPASAPGGPHERSFKLATREPGRAARALASAMHRFYVGQPGPYFTRIAFIAGTGASLRARHVFTINFDGTGIRRVSDEHQPNLLPAWSTRGDLVYTAFVDGVPALVLRPADGAAPQLLARQRDLNTGAAFSPDGRSIAVSQSVDGNTDIYLLNRRGVVLRRLTDQPGIDISPSWSPRGDELAFVSDRGGSPQIYRLSLGGGEVRRLTGSGFYNQEPAWCTRLGSRRIAYTHRYSGSRYEIHLLDADTGRSDRLTFGGGENTSPGWSPDCSLVLYAAKDRGLWLISPDGGRPHRVYSGTARSPAWSPRLPEHGF